MCEGRPTLAGLGKVSVTGSRETVGTEHPRDVLRCTGTPRWGHGVPGARLPSGLGRSVEVRPAGVPGLGASQTQSHASAQVPFKDNILCLPRQQQCREALNQKTFARRVAVGKQRKGYSGGTR